MKANACISAGVKQMGARLTCSEVGVGEDGGEAGFPVGAGMEGRVDIAAWVGPVSPTMGGVESLRVANQGNIAPNMPKITTAAKMRMTISKINSFLNMDYTYSYFFIK